MTGSDSTSSKIIYGVDDRPPTGRAVVLALQHVLTMFGATVSVPLLLGPRMGMTESEIAILISSVMVCSGLATLIQSTFGSRLPIIQGVSFSFLAAFLAIIAYGENPEHPLTASEVMQYIAGAILAGAVVEIVVGFSGLFGWLRRGLSPVVIGPVIMLIGLALFQHGAPKAGTYWPISGLTILLIILFSLVLSRRLLVFRIFPILCAIVLACGLCGLLTATGVFEPGHPAAVSLTAVHESAWLRANPAELVLPWGPPKFAIGFIVAALAGYLASMIESFGDYHACAQMAGAPAPTEKQISRGIGCEGIGCALTGLLGGFSSTSYSENIGLVGLTKVGSRYVVQIGAVMLIGLGLFAKFGAFAATIPSPVVGGLYCALFGLISAVGIRQFAQADLSSDRNLLIGGFILFMGLSVPAYFGGLSDYSPGWSEHSAALATWLGDVVAMMGKEEWSASFGQSCVGIIAAIGSTGMAVAAVLGLLLDNLIPGTAEERGIAAAQGAREK